jgi:hypothetical protein
MGQHARCNECSFSFFGGHSHHIGYSPCICLSCLSEFGCPTQSPWGARIGETIELVRFRTTGKRKKQKTEQVPTGVSFIVEQDKALQIDNRIISYLVRYPIETVPCPDCDRFSLSLGFEGGEICPKCKRGIVNTEFIEY